MYKTTFFAITLIFLFPPCYAWAGIDLPWSTTYECGDWNQYSDPLDCDGLTKAGAWTDSEGHSEQITSDANNPTGNGGKGQRHWLGDGTNNNSGGIRLQFNTAQTNFWMRWYVRWESGFGSFSQYKMLYIYPPSGTGAVFQPGYSGLGGIRLYSTKDSYTCTDCAYGATFYTNPSGLSDGTWQLFEMHINVATGVFQTWVNGTLVIDRSDVNYGSISSIDHITIGSNSKDISNGKSMYVDYDDIAVSNTGYIGPLAAGGEGQDITASSVSSSTPVQGEEAASNVTLPPGASDNLGTGTSGDILFSESFEDTNFTARGWYDNTNLQLTTAEHIPGSTQSLEFHFNQGATTPTSGGVMRKKFTETDQIHISYYVKYSLNWEGSNQSYHPHEFYILTNLASDWSSLASTNLTTYIEQNEGKPIIAIQDSLNIDPSNINVDLTPLTEKRAVAGCNGDSDDYGNGSCYLSGDTYLNGKQWKAGNIYFQDNTGPYYKNDWHLIEVFIKLNSITNEKANADGIIQYWYDGQLVIDHPDAIIRTGQHPNMQFNQFIIGPYIGSGSPVDQTFWIDGLNVSTGTPTQSTSLAPPSGFQQTSN